MSASRPPHPSHMPGAASKKRHCRERPTSATTQRAQPKNLAGCASEIHGIHGPTKTAARCQIHRRVHLCPALQVHLRVGPQPRGRNRRGRRLRGRAPANRACDCSMPTFFRPFLRPSSLAHDGVVAFSSTFVPRS